MKVGLLWYDNSKRELGQKLARAAKRYRERFGQDANVCYVHPTSLPDEEERRVNGILVRTSPRILNHHIWMGEEQPQP
jgi:hypothetical protein